MEMIKILSSKLVTPEYDAPPPADEKYVRLSPFDVIADDGYIDALVGYRPPTPPNSVWERSLRKVLPNYREWAGRLGTDPDGKPAIVLNDKGVVFVEASVDKAHDDVLGPHLDPSPVMAALLAEPTDELLQMQLTRFSCGTLVVGFAHHHRISDAYCGIRFLASWAKQSRGISGVPLPVHDRCSFFSPRSPPLVEFPHWKTEYKQRGTTVASAWIPTCDTVVHRAHFSPSFIRKLKSAAASQSGGRRYSTFECVQAHLWRSMTKVRNLEDGQPVRIQLAVNGRKRITPPVPESYLGNLVLWAICKSTAGELTRSPLSHAAEIIHSEIAKIDDRYFKSFIDFSSTTALEKAGLEPVSDLSIKAICPDLEVNSWLGFPMPEMDFGSGKPFYFIPSYYPLEGLVFLVDCFHEEEGSIDAYVALFEDKVDSFKKIFRAVDLEEGDGEAGSSAMIKAKL